MKLPGKTLFIGGAILALGIGSGIAVAQIPSQTGVFSACYVKSTGTMRIVDENVSCKNNETKIQWNQTGQQGAPGLPGEDGEDGEDGTSGFADYEVNTHTFNFVAGADSASGILTVLCPAGQRALGGGGAFLSEEGAPAFNHELLITSTIPTPTGTGWVIGYHSTNMQGLEVAGVRAYATCATVDLA